MAILVVDDDIELGELVSAALHRDRFSVVTCGTAEEGLERLRREPYQLVIVDLGLPGMNGQQLIGAVRGGQPRLPILVLTAKSAISAKVTCFDLGADDYLTKPFAVAELRARIRALLRRQGGSMGARCHRRGSVELDFAGRRARLGSEEAPITAREWAILEVLFEQVGEVVSKTELAERLWRKADEASQASLEVLVGRIRRKLGDDVLRTVRGLGYLLEAEETR